MAADDTAMLTCDEISVLPVLDDYLSCEFGSIALTQSAVLGYQGTVEIVSIVPEPALLLMVLPDALCLLLRRN